MDNQIKKISYLESLKNRGLIKTENTNIIKNNKNFKIKSFNKKRRNASHFNNYIVNKKENQLLKKVILKEKKEIKYEFKFSELNNIKFLNKNLYEGIKYKIIENKKIILLNLLSEFFKKIMRIKSYLENKNIFKIKFPLIPYENKLYIKLIESIKYNFYFENFSNKINFSLLHNFDSTKQTAVHHACKNNKLEILIDLIEKGSDYDSEDIIGRTPLIISVMKENIDCIRYLLYKGACPWIKDKHIYYTCLKIYKNNFHILKLIKTAKLGDIHLKLTNKKNKEDLFNFLKHKYLNTRIKNLLKNYD